MDIRLSKVKRHSFLDLKTETEAIYSGINFKDRAIHYIYKAIVASSLLVRTGKGTFFTYDSYIEDCPDLILEDRLHAIETLCLEKVIAQILYISYNQNAKILQCIPCFVSRLPDGKGTPHDLYEINISSSVKSIDTYLENREALTAELFTMDLEKELNAQKMPPVNELTTALVDPFQLIGKTKMLVPPVDEMVPAFLEDITATAMSNNMLLEIPGMGYIPLIESELLERFDTAVRFMVTKLIPRALRDEKVTGELQEVTAEENSYTADPFASPVPRFSFQRALILRSFFTRGKVQEPVSDRRWYPGRLTLETILRFEGIIEAKYQERWANTLSSDKNQLKEEITGSDSVTNFGLKTYTEQVKSQIHPVVWEKLIHDDELIYLKWETDSGTRHLLLHSDEDNIARLIHKLSLVSSVEEWKTIAIIKMIEANYQKFPSLRFQQDFQTALEKVRLKAYVNYIPWFLRVLYGAGLHLLQEKTLSGVAIKIMRNQDTLAIMNREKQKTLQKQGKKVTQPQNNRAPSAAMVAKIIDRLDELYFERDIIPTFAELASALPEIEENLLLNTLKLGKFQLIPGDGNPSSPRNHLVVHPVDHEWKIKSAHIQRTVQGILARLGTNLPAKPDERAIWKRAHIVQRLLTEIAKRVKQPTAPKPLNQITGDRLTEVIKKYN